MDKGLKYLSLVLSTAISLIAGTLLAKNGHLFWGLSFYIYPLSCAVVGGVHAIRQKHALLPEQA